MTNYLTVKTYTEFQQLFYQNYTTDKLNFRNYAELFTEWFETNVGKIPIPEYYYYYNYIPINLENGLQVSLDTNLTAFFTFKGEQKLLKDLPLNPCLFLHRTVEEITQYQSYLNIVKVKTEGLNIKWYLNPCYFSVSYAVVFDNIPKENISKFK